MGRLLSLLKTLVSPTKSVEVAVGTIRADELTTAETLHIETAIEDFADACEPEVAERLIGHIAEIGRDTTGPGTHIYHRGDREAELEFERMASRSTVFHELGHAVASAYGYYRHDRAVVPANEYDGGMPDWPQRPRRYMLRAPTGRTSDYRIPGYGVTSTCLSPDRPLDRQDWRPATDRASDGDYVRFGSGSRFGRVLSADGTYRVRTASGETAVVSPDDVDGYIGGMPAPREANTPAERVDKLVAEANKAWYRMYTETQTGFTPDVPRTRYGMTNAHETLAQAHECLLAPDANDADFAEGFPNLHDALVSIYGDQTAR